MIHHIFRHNKLDIKLLWAYIKEGLSVKSATYSPRKEEFAIELTSEPWPTITLACCNCQEKYLPVDLVFQPYPGEYYCCHCAADLGLIKAVW